MDVSSGFYTRIDHEIMELVAYHKNFLKGLEKRRLGEDNHEKVKMLDKFLDIVEERARQRQRTRESELKEQEELLLSRQQADCETCQGLQQVTIVREELDEMRNKCDVVVCQVCKTEFLNSFPNNWDDRTRFFEYVSTLMDGDVNGEPAKDVIVRDQVLSEVEADETRTGLAIAIQSHKEAVSQKQELSRISKLAEDALADFRDYLLQLKLSNQSFNGPSAVA